MQQENKNPDKSPHGHLGGPVTIASGARLVGCQNCKKDFIIEPKDFDFYEKMKVPAPTFCPECRARRRFMWRSENALYKRKSDYSGSMIFSGFAPDAPVKIYENDIYYSDKWDPTKYGQEIDFSKPFFEQIANLFKNVPIPARSVTRSENSDYCNWITAVKNGYLLFNTTGNENSAYGNAVNSSMDCVDNSHLDKCELCYECFWLSRCNLAVYSSQCEDCVNIYFCKNLYGCSDCFGSVNLRNKKYYIWNEPYIKEEYFKKLESFNLGSRKSLNLLKEQAIAFHAKFPTKFMDGIKNVNVSGEYISNSKNVYKSYLIKEGENLRYCQYLSAPTSKDCCDHSSFGNNVELTYECAICGLGAYNIKFCWWCWPDVRNLEYCLSCGSSSDLFGCVSLRNKQYCIFNKQYTKEEYEELVPKIIEHMKKTGEYGEFFPVSMSPFAYNDTITPEHWSITKEQAQAEGYKWRDLEKQNYQITIPAEKISDSCEDIPESISNEVIECEHKGECKHRCSIAFRVIPQEFQFYKKMNLPLPQLCPNCRREERLSQRQKLKFWHRKCMKLGCANEFETSYAPDRPEIVYCEQCYQNEVA